MSASPRVSVIVPAWNAAATLPACLASIRAQQVTDWEALVIDDGSGDETRALAASHARRDPRIHVLGWDRNRGAAAARNAGIRAATGRYLAFLDADDLWEPQKLAVQLAHMEATGAGLVFSAYRRMDAAGRDLGLVRVPARLDHAGLLRGNVIGCLTAIYDTAQFGRIEMPNLRRRQDYGLWLRLLRQGGIAHGLDEALARYRVHKGSLSADKLVSLAGTWAVYRHVAGLGRGQAAYYMMHNLAGGLKRRWRARTGGRAPGPTSV